MISLLQGKVFEQTVSGIVLLCGSVGYGVAMTTADQGSLRSDAEVTVYIYEHIKEDAHDLYGFTSKTTKALFEQLLSVTGVGPKMALAILNVGSESNLRTAIATGDTKYISQASGVGKKVAERVVVDLKDKVGQPSSDDATSFLQAGSPSNDEAAQALVALGYSLDDAAMMLKGVASDVSTEERVRAALRGGR